MFRRACSALVVCLLLFSSGCASGVVPTSSSAEDPRTFRIIAGSEIKTIQPVIEEFFKQKGLPAPRIDLMGAVDVSNKLSAATAQEIGYDAVWTANPFWIELGDTGHRVKNVKTIMKSPVVFGVKESSAKRLGWVDKPVSVSDILKAAEDGKFKFMMTSATQSNSGAMAYLGFLHAFNGGKTPTEADLAKPEVRDQAKRLFSEVDRSSGSSSFLNDFFVTNLDRYDAEINYEALVIGANRGEAAGGKKPSEPIHAVYPTDGLAISSSSLGYIDGGDAEKAAVFNELQAYLLSEPAQQKIRAVGWRTGLGINFDDADKSVFNPAWGIDTARTLTAVRLPRADVVRAAFNAYQTTLRKPSLTVYCLDVSGSMGESSGDSTGLDQVKTAMRTLLDSKVAEKYYLQPSADDVTVVIPFASTPEYQWVATGNTPKELGRLLDKVTALTAGGQTDIYTPAMQGLDYIESRRDLDRFSPSIVLLTDGASNTGADLQTLFAHSVGLHMAHDVPIYSIEFGNADPQQLDALAQKFKGKVFDGRKDLVGAFREAKGYN
jgi:Ca-activated chloride channel homolog